MAIVREPVITGSKLRLMWSRMVKVARFDGETLRELKNDEKATGQSVTIVALAGVSYGLGVALIEAVNQGSFSATALLLRVLFGMISAILATLVWSITTFLIGTKLFKGSTNFQGLVRPLFYSTSPALLFVLIAIPVIPVRQVIGVLVWGWTLVAGVFALKHSMGFSKERSMLTFIVAVGILVLLGGSFLTAR